MKRVVILGFCLLMCLSCSKKNRTESSANSIIIGVQKNAITSVIYLAEEMGFFDDEGIDVIIKEFPSGKLALNSMLRGEVDLATTSEIPVMIQSFQRNDFSILSSIGSSVNGAWVLARKESGINKPGDLTGKRIATQWGSAVHFFLHIFQLQHQISDEDVEHIFEDPAELTKSLIEKRVDAISMRNPYIKEAKEVIGEENCVEFFEPGIYSQPFLLVAKNSLLNSRSGDIEKVLKGCLKAELYIRSNRQEAMYTVASRLGADLESEVFRAWEFLDFDISLNQSLLLALEDSARWALEDNIIESSVIPNYLEYIWFDALKAVSPESVTILPGLLPKVILAETPQPLNGLIYIAREKGFFKEEGIDIEYSSFSSGVATLNAVINDVAHLATTAEAPIVKGILEGEEIYTVATIQDTGRNVVILGRKDRGILKPEDLKGKRLGVTPGSGGEFFAHMFLLYYGMKEEDLTIVDVNPNDMFSSLNEGTVDAVCTWNPHVIKILKEMQGRVTPFYAEELYRLTFNLAGKKEYVLKHGKAIKSILAALIKAEEFVRENQEESKEIISRSIAMDPALLNELWDIYHFEVSLDNFLLSGMKEQTRWMIEKGLTDETVLPEFREFIYDELLSEVKRDAVRVR